MRFIGLDHVFLRREQILLSDTDSLNYIKNGISVMPEHTFINAWYYYYVWYYALLLLLLLSLLLLYMVLLCMVLN